MELLTTILCIMLVAFIFSNIYSKNKSSYKRSKRNIQQDTQHLDEQEPSTFTVEHMPYKKAFQVMTNYEIKLFQILKPIVEEQNLLLFTKVRMADIVYLNKNTKNFQYWFNRIKAKHVDFLICAPNSKPLLAIELDDSTHTQQDRKERDHFVDNVYMTIGLPILHVKSLNPDRIKSDIIGTLGLVPQVAAQAQ